MFKKKEKGEQNRKQLGVNLEKVVLSSLMTLMLISSCTDNI